jgi:flagellar biogenesis protein FliO
MSQQTLETRLPNAAALPAAMQRLAGLMRMLVARLSRAASPAQNILSIEERLTIGPKKMVMVVNCDGRRFLLATAGEMIAPLIEIQPPEEKKAGEAPVSPRRRKAGGE